MNEHHILHDKRQQTLNSTGTKTLEAASGEMAVKGSAETSPETATPSDDTGEDEHGTAADVDAQGHEDVGAETVDEHGHRREEGDLEERRAAEIVEKLEGVGVYLAGRGEGANVNGGEDLGVDAGVFEGEDGDESADDCLGCQGEGADWGVLDMFFCEGGERGLTEAEGGDGEPLSPVG